MALHKWSINSKNKVSTAFIQQIHQQIQSNQFIKNSCKMSDILILCCSCCDCTRSHEDFIKNDSKKTLLKMCWMCCHCVCCFSFICFAAADFFIELCDFFMAQSSCSDWFQCSTSCKTPASYSNLWYKACVCSDQGVQGGVPLTCQISDIKLAFARAGGFRGVSPWYAKSLIYSLRLLMGLGVPFHRAFHQAFYWAFSSAFQQTFH